VNSLSILESCRGELEDLVLQWLLHWAQAAYEGDKILTCKSKEGLLFKTFLQRLGTHLVFECYRYANSGNAGSSKMARLAK
jgi:hypothetical protein